MRWANFGPMAGGWWFMPLFGLSFMLIFIFFLSRIFGTGSCCNRQPPEHYDNTDDLKREISQLRAEITTLQEGKNSKENKYETSSITDNIVALYGGKPALRCRYPQVFLYRPER